MNTSAKCQPSLMPVTRALSGLLPSAYRLRPVRVKRATQPKVMVSDSAIQTSSGTPATCICAIA